MTLGTFLPLAAAFAGLVTVLRALATLRALPGRTEMGHDEGAPGERMAAQITIAVGIALPILMYVMVNIVTDTGTLRLF